LGAKSGRLVSLVADGQPHRIEVVLG